MHSTPVVLVAHFLARTCHRVGAPAAAAARCCTSGALLLLLLRLGPQAASLLLLREHLHAAGAQACRAGAGRGCVVVGQPGTAGVAHSLRQRF